MPQLNRTEEACRPAGENNHQRHSQEPREDDHSLDATQNNVIQLSGCTAEVSYDEDIIALAGEKNIIKLNTKKNGEIFFAFTSREDMLNWLQCIEEASKIESSPQKTEPTETVKLAKELSDLVVYCESRPFKETVTFEKGNYREMSSFSELRMGKLSCRETVDLRMLPYHERQISRVYPKGTRFDSSNYDPVPAWNIGAQMCALNYQTSDRSMQIERGIFQDNGGCGYVLKPQILMQTGFNPHDPSTFHGVEPLNIRITVISARHLQKPGRTLTSPFIEIHIIGLDCDNSSTFRTTTITDNGLAPVWVNQLFDFYIVFPPLAKIHFIAKHEDLFGDDSFIAQACFPVESLRTGHRSIPLRNAFGEEIPPASILIDIRIQKAVDDVEYAHVIDLRDKLQHLVPETLPETVKTDEDVEVKEVEGEKVELEKSVSVFE